MRTAFVNTLIELAESNHNIELVTGDLGFGVLKPFWEKLPNQFTNAGIAEQNMTSMAAGMALEGKIVFTYSIGNFPTLRCLEQIRNDCAYHNANVKIVCIGGGFVYGSLGMSHHATEDIAILRSLPNVTVICPGDSLEAEMATRAMVEHNGTCYFRLGRGGEKRIHQNIDNFMIGKAIKIRTGTDVAVFSTGSILEEVCKAVQRMEEAGISVEQYSFPTVKPIDREVIIRCAEKCSHIISIEEHNVVGGFGSAVAEVLVSCGTKTKLKRLGVSDEYCTKVGSQEYLREQYGLSEAKMFQQILQFIGEA